MLAEGCSLAEWVFLLMWWSGWCLMQERRPEGRENFSCLTFPCLVTKPEFRFTSIFTGVTAPLPADADPHLSPWDLPSSPALCSTCCHTDEQPDFLLPPYVSRAGGAGPLQFTCAGNHILSFAVLPKIFLGIQWSVDSKMFLNTFVLSDKSSKD